MSFPKFVLSMLRQPGSGRGVSVQFAFGSYLSQVAEVAIAKDGGVRGQRVVCAVDCGMVVNPDTVRAQIKGGIIFGITAALYGQITLKDGRVEQQPVSASGSCPRAPGHIEQKPPVDFVDENGGGAGVRLRNGTNKEERECTGAAPTPTKSQNG